MKACTLFTGNDAMLQRAMVKVPRSSAYGGIVLWALCRVVRISGCRSTALLAHKGWKSSPVEVPLQGCSGAYRRYHSGQGKV